MRILHILDHSLPVHSGYAFRSQSIFQTQKKRGWRLAVLTSPKHQESWKGKRESKEMIDGVQYYRTTLSTSSSAHGYYEVRLMSALSRRIQEVATVFRPDLIHAHSPVLNALPALRAGRRIGIPVVYEIRAFWEDAGVDQGSYREGFWKYRLIRMLETRVCRKADHVTVLCDGLRQDLTDRGMATDKLSIAHNGIDPEYFQECPPDEEMALKWSLGNRQVIGFFGSFYRYEGLDLLLDAFSLLAMKHKNCSLLLIGGGETADILKEKAKILGIADHVIIPGRIAHERMPAVYALADIMVYPRYSIRLTELVTPLKPLEAMAMKKAVVASDVGGHKELVKDGQTGVLFKAGDVCELVSALEKLLLNKESRLALAERAQSWVRRERTWDKTTEVYEAIYEKVRSQNNEKNLTKTADIARRIG